MESDSTDGKGDGKQDARQKAGRLACRLLGNRYLRISVPTGGYTDGR